MMLKPIGDFKIGWEKSYFKLDSFHGEVTEWLNVAVSKTVVRANVPRVRIPLSPPPLVIQTPVKYPAHPWSREIESNWLPFSHTGTP